MNKYFVTILAAAGSLLLIPGFSTIFRAEGGFSAILSALGLFFLLAIVLGLVGAVVALNKTAKAGKVLAAATISGVLAVIINLYLLLTFEGSNLRYSVMGLLLIALATGATSRVKDGGNQS